MLNPSWRRVVLKVGSALIAPDNEGCSEKYLRPIAEFIRECRALGREVILVSSGSVAAGRHHFNFQHHRVPMALKRAMAAVGQNEMMNFWSRCFDFPCAQVLLTHGDLSDRVRHVNVQNTMRRLLDHGVLPIVNENDTIATEELKVGDNDNLAAMVATVTQADALIICSDVDGLYTADPNKDPKATLIPTVKKIDQRIYDLAGGATSSVGTGGMRTKIEAAEKATTQGVDTVILDGHQADSFQCLLAGKNPGTIFYAQKNPLPAKKHWVRHTLRAKGEIWVDSGCIDALRDNGASLLSSGIVEVKGEFESGDAVIVRCSNGKRSIAKGVTRFSASELFSIKGQKTQHIADYLGYCPNGSNAVIHRSEMMLLEKI
ncbi:glutamate 5-kinase [Alishewanella sp. 16-MA]|uniref:Glutamate 5-kinase n=1 Tax=Alishewanella maricola TaxID=2795740 RepID=A0ABS8C065_9ALTE|nr:MULTISPECIES: glutamate 5-kinase [Gammaproteobacteria]MCB5225702.1 glutamate 5-kinase [Alishewanella maricola]MCC5450910.1 glutamate 5-kinase [Rheinheimera sp. UJ51]